MKYLLSLLSVLALIGAGCATTTTTSGTMTDTGDNGTVDLGGGVELEYETDEDDDVTTIVLGGSARVEVTMESGNFFFSPDTITAAPGEKVELFISSNTGSHTFVIDEIGLRAKVNEGEKIVFTAPSEPGSYAFYCDIGSHRAQGMEGVLIVQ